MTDQSAPGKAESSNTEHTPDFLKDSDENTITDIDDDTSPIQKSKRKRKLKTDLTPKQVCKSVKHVNVDVELDEKLKDIWTPTSPHTGFCDSLENVQKVVKILEAHTKTKYCCLKQVKGFGCLRIKDGVRVWFDEKSDTKSATVIPYDSIPYVFLGKKVLMCSLGPDKHKTVKKRLKEKYIESVNDPTCVKKLRMCRGTKKKDCTAQIIIKEVMKFSAYSLPHDTPRQRKIKSDLLKQAIKRDPECGEKRFYIIIPENSEHDKYHDIGAGIITRKIKNVKKHRANVKKFQTRVLEKMSFTSRLTSFCLEEEALKKIEALLDDIKSTLDQHNIHEELLMVPKPLNPDKAWTTPTTRNADSQQTLVIVESHTPPGVLQQNNEIHFEVECGTPAKANYHNKNFLSRNCVQPSNTMQTQNAVQTFPFQNSRLPNLTQLTSLENRTIQQNVTGPISITHMHNSINISHQATEPPPTIGNSDNITTHSLLTGHLASVGGVTPSIQPITMVPACHGTQSSDNTDGIGQVANVITTNNQLDCNGYTTVNQWTNPVHLFNPAQQPWT